MNKSHKLVRCCYQRDIIFFTSISWMQESVRTRSKCCLFLINSHLTANRSKLSQKLLADACRWRWYVPLHNLSRVIKEKLRFASGLVSAYRCVRHIRSIFEKMSKSRRGGGFADRSRRFVANKRAWCRFDCGQRAEFEIWKLAFLSNNSTVSRWADTGGQPEIFSCFIGVGL